MRAIRKIVIHCSATPEGRDVTAKEIDGWHRQRGWKKIGYHYVIRLDGTVEVGRPESEVGSHVQGHNADSIGIVYAGGLDAKGKPKDTRTPAQVAAMTRLVQALAQKYPTASVVGHRDLSPDKDRDGTVEPHEWLKACPSFDAPAWWASVKRRP